MKEGRLGQLSIITFIKNRLVVIFLNVIFGIMAVQALASENMRLFEDDAGLFNPLKGPLKISFQLLKETDIVEIRVRDFRGQIVSNVHLVELRAGDHTFLWEGKDTDGVLFPDGRYTLLFRASFSDGLEETAAVDLRIAAVKSPDGVPAPEPLPPKEQAHRVRGAVSTFWRHNGDRDTDKDSGEARLRADFSFKGENRQANGVFSVLQPFYSGAASYNGSRALAEQRWHGGRLKGVFREGLGNFNDPMKLFSDFQSERKKSGLYLDHAAGDFDARGLVFGTEGDVDSEEQGAAVRMTYGSPERWRLGASYTFREALAAAEENGRSRNHALAADLRLPFSEALALVMEAVHTSDSENKDDDGYVATAVYDAGRLRFSGGYIDMGRDFTAAFADPLQRVTGDAKGLNTSVDYARAVAPGPFINPAVTLSFFDLERYSDGQALREVDTSVRFGVGSRDTFYLSWYGQEEGDLCQNTIRGNAEHKWDESWVSRLQASHSFADLNRTWRFTLDATRRKSSGYARLAAEGIKREIDTSRLSPFHEANLRFDWHRELWGLQLQARHSHNQEASGDNFFGRVEYKPVFLHRYRLLAYTSVGNRAAFSFERQVELGLEMQY